MLKLEWQQIQFENIRKRICSKVYIYAFGQMLMHIISWEIAAIGKNILKLDKGIYCYD